MQGGSSEGGSRTRPGRAESAGTGRSHSGGIRRGLAGLLVRGANAATRGAARLVGDDARAGRELISEAELRELVAASTTLAGDSRKIIDEVLAAAGRHVRELMVPRTEVVFLDAGLTVTEAIAAVRAARHSRFPVIDGTHDDVVGFVHLRDLLLRPDGTTADTVGELARELKRIPASLRVLPALSQLRREGCHVALVEDEYGGTAGIVTLEDLIEELVGEIHDEYDAAPEPALAEGVAPSEVEGLLNLSDFAERVGFELPGGPYDTVGGFVMAQLGRLPDLGDEVTVAGTAGDWHLRVVELDGRRAARVALAPVLPLQVPAPARTNGADLEWLAAAGD